MRTTPTPTRPQAPQGQTHYSPPHIMLMSANFLSFLFIIPVIAMAIWLAKRHPSDCFSFLHGPLIVISFLILIISLIAFFAALRRSLYFLGLSLFSLLILLLLLLAFTIFAFVVIRGSHGHQVDGANFKEYRLNDYSPWMRNQMNYIRYWEKIKQCLRKEEVCDKMNDHYQTANELRRGKLTYVQSGCCKPPTACGFNFVNATNWATPKHPQADVDCSRWSNKQDELCYDCNSCRAALIRTVKKDWGVVAKVTIAMLAVMFVLYAVSVFACMKVRREAAIVAERRRPLGH